MTPCIFFTSYEIAYLRNRRACGFLPELPGDSSWWDQDQNFKTKFLTDLYDSRLAQEAFDLMFGDMNVVGSFSWRMVDFEEHELVMRNIRATDMQGEDPSNEATVNTLRERLKTLDVDAIQNGTSKVSVEANEKVEQALDRLFGKVSGQGVDDEIDDLTCGGFIVEDSDECDDTNEDSDEVDDTIEDSDEVDGMIEGSDEVDGMIEGSDEVDGMLDG
jgi:hypothetical protein